MNKITEKEEQITHCINRIRLLSERISIADDGKTLAFPDDLTKSEWFEFHCRLMYMRKHLRAFINQSRDYAADKYGVDYVADSELQMELELGMVIPDPSHKPQLNPADKSKAIVTIEGVSQQFALWLRKMDSQIDSWDRPRIEKALSLIEPIEQQAKRLRGMLGA